MPSCGTARRPRRSSTLSSISPRHRRASWWPSSPRSERPFERQAPRGPAGPRGSFVASPSLCCGSMEPIRSTAPQGGALMTKLVVVVVVGLVLGLALFLSPAAGAQGPLVPFGNGGQTLTTPRWPAVTEQLARDGVLPGSALETLIRANQDFSRLRPGEADDDNPIPPWLRVLW